MLTIPRSLLMGKPAPDPAPFLEPRFTNFRGGMLGYSQESDAVNRENLEAFNHELMIEPEEYIGQENSSWDEIISRVESFLEFWCLYYCGIEYAEWKNRPR